MQHVKFLTITACKQDHDGTEFYPDPARKLSANLYEVPLLRVHWK